MSPLSPVSPVFLIQIRQECLYGIHLSPCNSKRDTEKLATVGKERNQMEHKKQKRRHEPLTIRIAAVRRKLRGFHVDCISRTLLTFGKHVGLVEYAVPIRVCGLVFAHRQSPVAALGQVDKVVALHKHALILQMEYA